MQGEDGRVFDVTGEEVRGPKKKAEFRPGSGSRQGSECTGKEGRKIRPCRGRSLRRQVFDLAGEESRGRKQGNRRCKGREGMEGDLAREEGDLTGAIIGGGREKLKRVGPEEGKWKGRVLKSFEVQMEALKARRRTSERRTFKLVLERLSVTQVAPTTPLKRQRVTELR